MLREVTGFGPVIGKFKDADICEWIEIEEGRFEYDGVITTPTFDPKSLVGVCLVVDPGIIYQKKSS